MTPKEQHPEQTRPASTENKATPSITSNIHLPTRERSSYDIEGELARGGLGRVLRAKDQHLGRVVAIKETLRDDNDIKERFLREALLTAKLQHPSIVPIYEAGLWPSGEPFYSMKLISGRPLLDAVQERETLSERLSLLPNLLAVCEAISYAHAKHVIHRDLKPQNILLGEFGETVVIDWGLAKELSPNQHSSIKRSDAQEGKETELTQAGSIIGTPAYMPPEQAKGFIVDERADVYALGAILYFLLSGAAPYQGKLGSDVIERVISKPPIPLSEREENIPQDLLAIVQKAMSRDVEQRYPSAKELSEDLKKYLNGQLVGAYHYSFSELFGRWFGRYRAAISIAALLMLVALGSIGYSFYRVNQARRDAEGALDLAEKRELEAIQQRQAADELRIAAELQKQKTIEQSDELAFLSARTILEKNPRRALALLADLSPNFKKHNALRLMVADALSRGDAKILSDKQREPFIVSPDKRFLLYEGESHDLHLWDLPCSLTAKPAGCTTKQQLSGPTSPLASSRFLTIDEKPSLLTSFGNGDLWLWDINSGEGIPLLGHKKTVRSVACLAATCFSASADGSVREWDLRTATNQVLFEGELPLTYIFLSPDEKTLYWENAESGYSTLNLSTRERSDFISTERMVGNIADNLQMLAYSNPDNSITLKEVNTGATRLLRAHNTPILRMFFSSTAKKLLSFDKSNRLFVWDTATGRSIELKDEHTRVMTLTYAVFSPDDGTLVTYQEGAIFFWDIASGDLIERRDDNQFPYARFSPDSKLFAYPGVANTVRLWSRTNLEVLLGHQNQVVRVEFSPDGRYLASSGYDSVVRVWDTQAPIESRWALYGHIDEILQLSWLDDQTLASSGFADKVVRVWQLTTQEGSVVEGVDKESPLAISPDKGSLAFAKEDGVQYCQITRALLCQSLPEKISDVTHLAFSPDGTKVLATSHNGTIRVWSLTTQQSFLVEGHSAPVLYATFSWSGEQIASIAEDNTTIIWDASTKKQKNKITRDGAAPHFLLFSPDDKYLFSSGQDWWKMTRYREGKGAGYLWVWDVSSGASRKYFSLHGALRNMIISPDQKTLLTAGEDWRVRLWDLSCLTTNIKSEEISPCSPNELVGHRGRIYQMRFSPDGKLLATAGDDNTLRLWSYETGESIQSFRGHTHSVVSVDFSPDGSSLVSGGLDGTVRIWDTQTGESRVLRGHQDMVTQSVFSAKESVVSIAFDGSVRLWNDDLPKDPTKLREWLRVLISRKENN